MMKINAMLMTDFYKISHRMMSEEGTELIYSTMTARMTRIPLIDKITVFNIQGTIKSLMIDFFNENFFDRDKDEVIAEYSRIIKHSLFLDTVETSHIKALHELGYLPLKVTAMPEGSLVPIRVPFMTIENTIPEFYWLVNYMETMLSAEIWKPITSTSVVRLYRDICMKYAKTTAESTGYVNFQCHNFSYRGMSNNNDAMTTGAGHLLFFDGTDTIPSIPYLEKYYMADVEKELVGTSVLATEHSIQCGFQEDDLRYVNRMLDIVPQGILSVVSDGYDYWKMLTSILPQVKNRIMSRDGKYVVRPDSGDPVQIICGKTHFIDLSECEKDLLDNDNYDIYKYAIMAYIESNVDEDIRSIVCYVKLKSGIYTVDVDAIEYYPEYGIDAEVEELESYNIVSGAELASVKGSVEVLWELFGGTINSKGFKVLDPHIGLIYGDSITPERADMILQKLKDKKFSAENIVFGIGSYSLGYYTRDTFGMAVKAVHTKINGKEINIFKDPKTDIGGMKKSQRGMCVVVENDGVIDYIDGLDTETILDYKDRDLLELVFINGKQLNRKSLSKIRSIVRV